MGRWRLTLQILSLLLIVTITSSCTIGLRKETRIVYAGFAKQPEEFKGALRVATNDEIPVTIVGDKETYSEMSLGGYYIVSPSDLKAFVEAVSNE
jgi:hypothetical protein